jgi:hypothetical protein
MPRERAFLLPCPRIQIVTESVSTKTPSNLSSQKAQTLAQTIDQRATPSPDVFPTLRNPAGDFCASIDLWERGLYPKTLCQRL